MVPDLAPDGDDEEHLADLQAVRAPFVDVEFVRVAEEGLFILPLGPDDPHGGELAVQDEYAAVEVGFGAEGIALLEDLRLFDLVLGQSGPEEYHAQTQNEKKEGSSHALTSWLF